jgi:hypothetical protein
MKDAKLGSILLLENLDCQYSWARKFRLSYSSVVGNIMYLMICNRTNIVHDVRVMSCFLSCSDRVHWETIKFIFFYFKGITSAQLEFERSDARLINYVDYDFIGDFNKRWLLIAYVFIWVDMQLVGMLLYNSLLHYQQRNWVHDSYRRR